MSIHKIVFIKRRQKQQELLHEEVKTWYFKKDAINIAQNIIL